MSNLEPLQLACIVAGVLLWSIGGMWKKWVRRYVLFVVFAIIGIIAGIEWWRVVSAALLGSIASHLPYGDRTPYWLKFIVGMTYGAATLPLGFTLWQIVVGVVFIITFYLSNSKFQGEFPWRVCEALTGFLIGLIWGVLIL